MACGLAILPLWGCFAWPTTGKVQEGAVEEGEPSEEPDELADAGAGADAKSGDATGKPKKDTAGGDVNPGSPAPGSLAFGECEWAPPGTFECASSQVPLDWSQPNGEKITLQTARWPAAGTRTGQLWLLQGGPGGAGTSLAGLAWQIAKIHPDLDIYLPDHRGTGRSTRLFCPKQESPTSPKGLQITDAEWPACLTHVQTTWGSKLQHFSTTAAARDLQHLIASSRLQDERVVVYGVSYGTYWAHRHLQLFPDQADGTILDSSCVPGKCRFDQYDVEFNAVAKAFLQQCSGTCADKLGPDAWGKLAQLHAKLKGGHCQSLHGVLGPAALKRALAVLLMYEQTRTLIPPVVYRYERCAAGDVVALKKLASQLLEDTEQDDSDPLEFSQVLRMHVGLSELTALPVAPPQACEALFEATLVAPNACDFGPSVWQTWPRYEAEALANLTAVTQQPLLFLQGSLDPQTPPWYAKAMAAKYKLPQQQYVEVPTSAHGVLLTTDACVWSLTSEFLLAPDQTGPPSCTAGFLEPSFEIDPALTGLLLGVGDAWEGMPKGDALNQSVAELPEEIKEAKRRIRRGGWL